ncbi:MAG: transcription termination/antitermination protein NusG [Terriglobia bacterium]
MSFSELIQVPPIVPFSGTIAGEHCWYAVHTRSRHEKKVAVQLERKGVESYAPIVSEIHRWSDRRQTVQVPLFPGYVFVRIDSSGAARLAVLETLGVVSFVGARGQGISIPDKQIADIRAVVQSGLTFAGCPCLEVGQHVRIRGGCLDGVEGILLAKNSDRSVVVSVNLIQRALAVRVDGFDVEPIR